MDVLVGTAVVAGLAALATVFIGREAFLFGIALAFICLPAWALGVLVGWAGRRFRTAHRSRRAIH